MLETERELLVLVALPGVDPDQVEAAIEDGALVVAGQARAARRAAHRRRSIGSNCRRAASSAAFRCRPGATTRSGSAAGDGCLLISLRKAA